MGRLDNLPMLRLPASLCLAASFWLVLLAAPHPDAAAEQELPTATRIEAEPVTGRLTALDAEAAILEGPGGKAIRIPLDSLQELSLPRPVAGKKAKTATWRVTLMCGAELLGDLEAPDGDGLGVALARSKSRLRLPYEAIRHLERLPAKGGHCARPALQHGPEKSKDIVWRAASRDRISGTLADADGRGVVLEDERERDRRVGWGDVLVLHLDNDPIAAPEGVQVEIEHVNGSRLTTSKPPRLEGGNLQFALRANPTQQLRMPLEEVASIRASGGRFVYASDLAFESTYTPFHEPPADAPWVKAMVDRLMGTRADQRADGCPLRLAGRIHRKGLYVHSHSVVKIPLEGAYSNFQCLFGILDDDPGTQMPNRTPEKADVVARIVADGKTLWEEKDVTLARGALHVGPLDVKGVKVLELIVEFGRNQDVCDDAGWVNPILVRK